MSNLEDLAERLLVAVIREAEGEMYPVVGSALILAVTLLINRTVPAKNQGKICLKLAESLALSAAYLEQTKGAPF